MVHIYDYSAVAEVNISLRCFGGKYESRVYVYGSRRNAMVRGRTAYISSSLSRNLLRDLSYSMKKNVTPSVCPTLFIDPASKVSRDYLRRGGFQVTYSKEKADCIVVPYPSRYGIQPARFVFLKDTILYMCRVYREYAYDDSDLDLDETLACIEGLKRRLNVFESEIVYSGGKEFQVYFLKKCDSFREIFSNKAGTTPYCFDTDVLGQFGNAITTENLTVWSKMKDTSLLEKSLLMSNWQDYPFTVATMLAIEHPGLQYRFSSAGKIVLDKIPYIQMLRILSDDGDGMNDIQVAPDDWNLLQSFIMSLYGCSENGGYVKACKDPYLKFLPWRIAIKPYRLDEMQSVQGVMQNLRYS